MKSRAILAFFEAVQPSEEFFFQFLHSLFNDWKLSVPIAREGAC
jgi:hypothetical protein